MSNCPCCSNSMLRHIRCGEIYWFCRSCYQEMPEFSSLVINRGQQKLKVQHGRGSSFLLNQTEAVELN